jgi:hypothetical protein
MKLLLDRLAAKPGSLEDTKHSKRLNYFNSEYYYGNVELDKMRKQLSTLRVVVSPLLVAPM